MIFLHHQNLQKLKKKMFFAVHSKAEVFSLSSPFGVLSWPLGGCWGVWTCDMRVTTESFQHICLWGQT